MHKELPTASELIAFESSIAEKFNNAEIPYPVHLSGGNELQLLNIFEDFKEGDYCFSQWRNHYHALLAGIPPEKVKTAIMAGRSMTLCWPEHRFFSSAIVAGCIPIALGVAWQIKRDGGKERVWCFIGEMTAETGMAHECIKYATWNDLPITFVIEDNGKSVCTKTKETWGELTDWKSVAEWCLARYRAGKTNQIPKIRYYKYHLAPYPHAGAGVRVEF